MTDSDRVLRTTEVLDNGQVFQGRVKCVENCGEVVNVRHGRGRLTLPNGSVLRGTWTNGDLRGYVVLTDQDGATTEGEWRDDGFEGECIERYADGELQFKGSYTSGRRHGYGCETLPDGCKLVGEWRDDNFHGRTNEYIYPDGECALVGEWENGEMVAAKFRYKGKTVSVSLATIYIRLLLSTTQGAEGSVIFRLDESTDSVISSDPLLQDPYEKRNVKVGKSKMARAGEGLFARKKLRGRMLVSYYNGVRLPEELVNDRTWEENGYTVSIYSGEIDDEEEAMGIDIPPAYREISAYCASLAHKANHSSCPNSELEFCRHPRFGDIKCIVTLHEIDEDEEITIDYGYGDFKHRKGASKDGNASKNVQIGRKGFVYLLLFA
eukprot:m.152416 g.152416  ORF g.152416 m.152416 type:complete len:380 (+) comp15055_c0_seq1:166-1305(+)